MSLFSKAKKRDVQAFVLHLLNHHCPDLGRLDNDDARRETRTNLSLVVLVVPIQKGKPDAEQAFTTVTKEFGTTGVALVLGEPRPLDDVFLVFRHDARITYIRGKAKHLSPIGAGFFQLGIEFVEVVPETDCPDLVALAEQFH
jgi:hypothetical protein